MLPRTRYEAVMIAYICGCNPSQREIESIKNILLSDKGLLIKPHDANEVDRFLRYLQMRGKLKVEDGRYVALCEKITRPMRIVARSLYPKVIKALAEYGINTSYCRDEIGDE